MVWYGAVEEEGNQHKGDDTCFTAIKHLSFRLSVVEHAQAPSFTNYTLYLYVIDLRMQT